MVFQQFNLFPHLTAGENVMLAPKVVNKAHAGEATELARRDAAPRSASPTSSTPIPTQLSGGQQQRVAIARALAMRPAVLLCDEITSALDPELVNEVLRVVEQLAAEGMTLMLVTHEMRFARDVGTKLVFMHQGRVHEEGPPEAAVRGAEDPRAAPVPRLDRSALGATSTAICSPVSCSPASCRRRLSARPGALRRSPAGSSRHS